MSAASVTVSVMVWLCRSDSTGSLVPVLGVPDSTISEPWYLDKDYCKRVCDIFNNVQKR